MSDKARTDQIADQEIFESLYKERHGRLLASLIGMVRDRGRAEDIAAAAFQTAWEKRTQFRGDSSLATWLYAIGFNAVRRSGWQERTVPRDPMHLETQRHHEPDRLSAGLEQDELRALVWKALDRIPAKCRRLLIDRYINGRSVQEIARREGVPIGTVGSRLFTAKRLLREAWPTTTPPGGDMREEKVGQIAAEALKRLGEELQAGRSDALKNYLAAMGRFHRYSWGNVLLINEQRPDATRVAGYHAWRELGRSVRRGEKGIMIFAPIVVKEQERSRAPEAAKPNDVLRVSGFRTAYVFDVVQTEGRPLPEFAKTTGDPQEFSDKLKAVVAQRGIALEYDPSIAPAHGDSSGGRIRLLPNLSPAEEFSVLAHELAHEMLHHQQEASARLPKVVRETQAEAVAFVVCRGVGLETNSAAADYIALYNGDAKMLADSLSFIQETSGRILSDLLPEERVSTQARSARSDRTNGERTGDRAERTTDSTPERVSEGPTPTDSVSMDR
jgi:RNA polymerase sigma factor (sigma-70 family)